MASSLTTNVNRPWNLLPNELKLEIVKHLDQTSLSRLARVNQQAYRLFTSTLYREDALKYNEAKAIRWATIKSSNNGYRDTAERVLLLALENGADINTVYYGSEGCGMALHIAAACGSVRFVRLLLSQGAAVNIPCRDLCDVLPSHINERFVREKLMMLGLPYTMQTIILSRSAWCPLLYSFIFDRRDIIGVLLEHGASSTLAIEVKKRGIPPFMLSQPTRTLTIHHLLAANEHLQRVDSGGFCLFQKFSGCVNSRLPLNGYTALHIAIETSNTDSFRRLINAGADIEALSDLRRTPLFHAIDCANTYQSTELVKGHAECIQILVDQGANINTVSHNATLETPLTALMKSALHNVRLPEKPMLDVLKLLIMKGAEVNHRPANGRTALHDLFELMCTRTKRLQQEEVLFKLFIEHGANINAPLPGGMSLLRTIMDDYDLKPLRVYDLVMQFGGMIFPHEADIILHKCLTSFKLRVAIDMSPYIRYVSQQAVNEAHLQAFDGKPNELYTWVRARFPVTTIPEELVAKAISRGGPKLSELTLGLRFDPNWIDPNGDSFLHLVVNKIEENPGGRVAAAVHADMAALVERGTRVTHRNARGMTVIQRLKQAPRQYDPLRLFLYEEKDVESGEY